MSEILVIQCQCGHSFSVLRKDLRCRPNAIIKCKGILKDDSICGQLISVDMLIRLPEDQKLHIVTPGQEKLTFR